jgi:hypothetical protein
MQRLSQDPAFIKTRHVPAGMGRGKQLGGGKRCRTNNLDNSD